MIAALVGADRAREKLQECGSPLSLQIVGCVVGIIILLYSVIRLERYISKGSLYGKARKNQLRTRGYVLLCVPAFLSFFLFLGPSIWPAEEALLREWLPMRKVFPLSGCVLIVSSACLLLLSLNFYDSAAGWRRGRSRRHGKRPIPNIRHDRARCNQRVAPGVADSRPANSS